MKTALKKGQITDSGFEILEIIELGELEADGIWAKHTISGAEVFHIYNDDTENLFSFAFTTVPEDSTGVSHILEHSVLCGSENYPLKDAFLVLAQGSLQTFLNAWTFPDKTLYPASSINDKDYFNLMAVYGDAVFRPLISEWTFMQEAHHLEFGESGNAESGDEKASGLKMSGVVYNEMKGSYSSLDAYAGLWSIKAVLPDTPYALESGGDPDCIPQLTWEGLKEYHKSCYSPANCRIFLAGNIPTEKQLAFLNEKFFSILAPGKAVNPIGKAKRWTKDQTINVACPAGEQKSTVFVSFLCGDATDTQETIDLAALTETLLGHDGSPLTRALIDSGLGEDLTPVSGLEGEIRETVFTVGLKGVKAADHKKVEALIFDTLRGLVEKGIPKEEVEAALLSMEFSHREIRRSGGPFSLVWMRRSLRCWLHGGKPWDSLLFAPLFDGLKQRLVKNPRFFETVIQKYFLDNPHRALVIVKPEKDFLEKKEAKLAEFLAQKEAMLSESDKKALKEKSLKLKQIQDEPDSPEALASIPHLSRKDLSAEIELIDREYLDAKGVPALGHALYTNGISYVDLAFPVDNFSKEEYLWLPFFSRAIVSMGLPGMDYGEVSSLLARTAGDFHAMLHTGSSVPSSGPVAFPSRAFDLCGRDWIIYRLKALDEKTGASLDLAHRMIIEADFSDLRRIRDLVLEAKNHIDSSLAPSGHSFVRSRSGRNFTRSNQVEESWSGLDQLMFIHKLVELDTQEIAKMLVSIRDILIREGLIVNLCGNAASIQTSLKEVADRFSYMGPPRAGGPLTGSPLIKNPLRDRRSPDCKSPASGSKPEIFASPSLQIGFAGMTLPGSPFGSDSQAAELVLSHLFSTGALWEEIRMKGGAYGAFASPDLLENTFAFATYRDPNPMRSIDAFKSILKTFDGYKGENLEKALIGSYSREIRPKTSAEKSQVDFLRLLYGVEDRHRARRLKAMINIKEDDIAQVLTRLASSCADAHWPVIITGTKDAEKAAKAFGVDVQKLPV
ncbi:MAG: insulinase family protein [Treponema sp.]|jgi:Zn-dependent M16 (insulinase) family peptidase|nr:insulinase family protein [Treponema sp.]